MRVALNPQTWPAWLGEQAQTPELKARLAPYRSGEMICWPVSGRVGNVENNDPSLVEPVAAVAEPLTKPAPLRSSTSRRAAVLAKGGACRSLAAARVDWTPWAARANLRENEVGTPCGRATSARRYSAG